MDRDDWRARTDIIVVVDPDRKQLLWVPRHLWCHDIDNRINAAFKRGGHSMLLRCLSSLGIRADYSVCLRRQATERALDGVTVTVPVGEPLRFWYPLSPQEPIEEGRKPVDFDPPSAVLSGERLHQWIGARTSRGTPPAGPPDLGRIRRQQVLVEALLEQGFDFGRAIADPELTDVSDPRALLELATVGHDWTYSTLDRVRSLHINGMSILTRSDDWRMILRAYRQSLRRLALRFFRRK